MAWGRITLVYSVDFELLPHAMSVNGCCEQSRRKDRELHDKKIRSSDPKEQKYRQEDQKLSLPIPWRLRYFIPLPPLPREPHQRHM